MFLLFKGFIVSAYPEDGCTKIEPPPKHYNEPKYFFALIKRGKCDFDVKVRNAQNSNYSLAIVYSNNTNIICK